jgi:hypothetical protein
MSGYEFSRGKRVFHVWAHNDISVRRRYQSDHPVVLEYDPPGRRPSITSQLTIQHGVPLSVIEEHFAGFIRKIEASSP